MKNDKYLFLHFVRGGLILYRGTICGLTEKTPFLYRYFTVLGQKISCEGGGRKGKMSEGEGGGKRRS